MLGDLDAIFVNLRDAIAHAVRLLRTERVHICCRQVLTAINERSKPMEHCR